MRTSLVASQEVSFDNILDPERQTFIDIFRVLKELTTYMVDATYVPSRPFTSIRLSTINEHLNMLSGISTFVTKYDYYFNSFSDKPISEYEKGSFVKVTAVSPDRFLSSTLLKEPIVWNITTRMPEVSLPLEATDPNSLMLSPIVVNDKIIGGYFNKIKVWDLKTGALERTFTEHTGRVTNIIKLPGYNRIASGSEDGTIRIWDLEEGEIAQMKGDEKNFERPRSDRHPISKILLMQDKYIVSGSFQGSIQIWDFNANQLVYQSNDATGDGVIIEKVDEHRIAAMYIGGILRILNISQFPITVDSEIMIAEEPASPDQDNTGESMIIYKDRVIIAMSTGTIKVYNTHTRKIDLILQGHKGFIQGMIILPNGNLMSSSYDHTLRIWNLHSGDLLQTLNNGPFEICDLIILPESNKIVVATFNNSIRIWE